MSENLDINEWQVAGIKQAIDSLDCGEGIPHDSVKEWVDSWGGLNDFDHPFIVGRRTD